RYQPTTLGSSAAHDLRSTAGAASARATVRGSPAVAGASSAGVVASAGAGPTALTIAGIGIVKYILPNCHVSSCFFNYRRSLRLTILTGRHVSLQNSFSVQRGAVPLDRGRRPRRPFGPEAKSAQWVTPNSLPDLLGN